MEKKKKKGKSIYNDVQCKMFFLNTVPSELVFLNKKNFGSYGSRATMLYVQQIGGYRLHTFLILILTQRISSFTLFWFGWFQRRLFIIIIIVFILRFVFDVHDCRACGNSVRTVFHFCILAVNRSAVQYRRNNH